MIEELGIRDLGVIAEAKLPLGAGFTAVTGETGAGKTMVVTALGLLLGARADPGVVRSLAKQSWVEGRWLLDTKTEANLAERVADTGGEIDNGELLLGRTVSAEGRSRAVVGGRSVPVGLLSELGNELVVVHGQADQQRLRSAATQREALDRFAGASFAAGLAEYRRTFESWRAEAAKLTELKESRDTRLREASDLRIALNEIEQVNPQPGEDVELADRAQRLENLETLRIAAGQAYQLIDAEGVHDEASPAALFQVDAASRHLDRVAEHDAALKPVAETLRNAGFLLSDAAAELAKYLAGLDTEGAKELAEVHERRAMLTELARKHGGKLENVIEFSSSGGLRLLELDSDNEHINELEQRVQQLYESMTRLAAELTTMRSEAAERLANSVSAELAELAMPDARLLVTVEPDSDYTVNGADQIAILLQPHPGTDPRPVARGASGGELSRVMLALEVVIAGTNPVPTFVFDEVDAGVGGAAAIEIGRRLARLALKSQVIVVTHLAQVAAFATNHLAVIKDNDGAVTESSVRQLSGAEREAEMARLLSGLPDSASGLAHARELLELAAR